MEDTTTFTTLDQIPELFNPLKQLIEGCFGYPRDQSFNIDFYPLMEMGNWRNLHLLIDANHNILAHLGIKFFSINSKVKICLMGGIVTHPQFRGKGYLKRLMTNVINLHHAETALFFLWGSEHALYEKFNFHLVGSQYVYEIKDGNTTLTKSSLDKMPINEMQELWKIHQQNGGKLSFLDRQETDWKLYSNISSVEVYSCYKNNRLYFYCLKNKGADLNNIIHEYACREPLTSLNIFPRGILWAPLPIGPHSYRKEKMALCRMGGSTHQLSDFPTSKIKELDHARVLDEYFSKRPLFISGIESV